MFQVESRRSIQGVARTSSKRSGKRVGLFVVSLMLFSTLAVIHVGPVHASGGTYFNNIVTILMENNGYCDVVTSSLGTGCGGTGTYERTLAHKHFIAGNRAYD